MTVWLWFAVAGVGGAGAIVRFVIDTLVADRARRQLPIGTLTINLSGTLLLGVLVGAGAEGNLYLLGGTAMLGSYTTFSTWMLETHRLAEDAELRPAIVNAVASLVLGFGAALLGRAIGLSL